MIQSHYLQGIIQPTTNSAVARRGRENTPAGRAEREQTFRSPNPVTPIDQMIAKDLKGKSFRSEAEMLAYAKHYEEAKKEALDVEIAVVIINTIVVGLMEQYTKRALRKLKNVGLYTMDLKKNINEISDTVRQLKYGSLQYETRVLTPLMAEYTTAVLDKYKNTGCLMNGLQYEWLKENGKTIDDLFMLCLNVHKQAEHPEHANIMADISVVDLLSQLAEVLTQQLVDSIPASVFRFFTKPQPDTRYRNIIHKRVCFIQQKVEGEYTKDKDKPQRRLTEQVNKIGNALLNTHDILIKVIVDCKNDYFLFYVTYIMQLFQQKMFTGLVKRKVREEINYFDPTQALYARCCKDWHRLARTVPWCEDIEDAKEIVRETTPKALNDFGRRILKTKYNIDNLNEL